MLSFLRKIISQAQSIDYRQLVADGAIILDVRTVNEFAGGHTKNAVNVPLNLLTDNLSLLKNKHQPIITCCASGMRSAIAKPLLVSKGYTNVYNGGTWKKMNQFTVN